MNDSPFEVSARRVLRLFGRNAAPTVDLLLVSFTFTDETLDEVIARLTVETSRRAYTSHEGNQVGVATFSNPEGLLLLGNNLWLESPNSGSRILGNGDNGTAGQVIGGSIENSNVDTAEQFVQLIEAQRGFQANARVITLQDEVLAELVNLI